MQMTNLQKLHNSYQQSPWLDNLSRDLISSGKLQQYIKDGIRGVTSNPTILEKAITSSSLYDEQIRQLASEGRSTEDIYWRIIFDDIRSATKMLEPTWRESNHEDGYISLEVSPRIARNTQETIDQAKWIWHEINMPNLMIKVPATDEGIPAIRELMDSEINVNVTLIFSLDHYRQVAGTHNATHHVFSDNPARSVASFFVSRVDTEIDKRLETIGTDEALKLRGKAAIAQSYLAYEIFLHHFSRSAVINSQGADVQRLLWASTSTKNPEYDDLMYVSNLLTPLSVNTLPEDTIAKINDHLPFALYALAEKKNNATTKTNNRLSEKTNSISLKDIATAHTTMNELQSVGIDIDDVTKVLEAEGIRKFQDSFDSLLSAIDGKK